MNTNSASCLLSKKCREQYSKEVNSKIQDENAELENIYGTKNEVKSESAKEAK